MEVIPLEKVYGLGELVETSSGLRLTKKEIRLPQGPLREIGEHEVQLHLHPEVDAPLKIVIAREDERPVSD